MAVHNELYVNRLKPGETFVLYETKPSGVPWQARLGHRLGSVLMVVAILGLVALFEPLLQAEISYRLWTLRRPSTLTTEGQLGQVKRSLFGELLWLDSKNIVAPADWQFSLIIPKLAINTPVVANVSPADEKEYNLALKGGVAHARGSGLPGDAGTVFIFGHSSGYLWDTSPYKTIFYPLNNLEANDEIIVIFADQRYLYRVGEKKIVNPDEVALLAPDNQKQLVLQTCWPPFTNWKRLVIIADSQPETQEQTIL